MFMGYRVKADGFGATNARIHLAAGEKPVFSAHRIAA
jgi:hypothetical protein